MCYSINKLTLQMCHHYCPDASSQKIILEKVSRLFTDLQLITTCLYF